MKHIMGFNENKKVSRRDLDARIDKIIEASITKYPYEGDEVDKGGLRESIRELLFEFCGEDDIIEKSEFDFDIPDGYYDD